MVSSSEVNFCVDTLLVETVFADPKLYKKAGFVQDLLGKVKDYFSAHIDKDNPVKSVVDILAPGVLWKVFSGVGLGKWGFLLSLLMNVFHVDAYGMLQSLWSKVKQMVGGGKKVSSAEVDNATQSTAQEFAKPGTEQEAAEGYEQLQKQQPPPSEADDGVVYSSLELLHDAKIVSLALIEYERQNMRLTKEAISKSDFLSGYSGTKAKGTSLLARIFGWIIKVALASVGLMVAGDVANELMGRPSALSGTYQAGKEKTEVATPPPRRSTQTKFPFKGDAPMPSTWPQVNNETNIENMLIQFAKDTYSGLDGHENDIRNSPAFQAVKDEIAWFNVHNPNSTAIFIPRNFSSKRGTVDYFIDDVAARVK